MRPVLAAALLFGVPLAGCIGGGGGSDVAEDDRSTFKSRAEVSASRGGIEGVVTDAAITPVAGANVTLLQAGTTMRTADDGSFAFSNLLPGVYVLQVEAPRIVPAEQEVDVVAGEVSTVDVIVARRPSLEPFSQQYEFTGFVECSLRNPAFGIALCAVPNILVENATNDRFLFVWPVEPDPWQMVVEFQWDANQPLGTDMAIIVEPEDIPNENQTFYAREAGTSPLITSVGRTKMELVDANMTAICSGEKEPEGAIAPSDPGSYCRPSVLEEGGNVWARLFSEGASALSPVRLGFSFQQEYRVIISLFYHAPACREYSVFNGTECEQLPAPPDGGNATGNETGDGGSRAAATRDAGTSDRPSSSPLVATRRGS